MLKRIKDFASGCVVTALIIALGGTAIAAYNRNINVTYADVKLNVNGGIVTPKDGAGNAVEPFIYKGTTYLPVRAVAIALGCDVSWDQASKTVYINGGEGGNSGSSGSTGNNSTARNLIDILPPFQSDLVKVFPSNGSESFKMGGAEYKNSLKFSQWLSEGFASFNLGGKYTILSGIAGITDDGYTGEDVTLTFTADGTVVKTLTIKEGTLPQDFSIDVTGVSLLRIDKKGGTTSGLAELKIQ
jgi:hypothetical protein